MRPAQLFWRASSAAFRRTGNLLVRVADGAYAHAQPRLTRSERALLQRNEQLRNIHAGQRCFVIGNGPSLARQDLSPLADEITFVMNAFWKHPILDEEKWQPTYYCFADGALFTDGSEPTRKFYRSLRERVHSTNYLSSLKGKQALEAQRLLPLDSTFFYRCHNQPLGLSPVDSIDLTGSIPWVFSASQLAMIAAIYMGCSPIYLLGLDHDWLIHRGQDRHFYSGPSIESHETATGELNYAYDLEMEAMWKLWQGYRKLKTVARARGLQILNATDGGFLDLFERVSYQSLFEFREQPAHRTESHA